MTLLTFAEFNALGYKRLVPVIPHDAAISDRSSLYSRVGTTQDGRGKTPGVKGVDDKWFSFDWTKHEADDRDLARWQAMQAGIGVKMGGDLVFIDADTMNKEWAALILMTLVKHFGVLPSRIGNFPKAGYPIRVASPMPYTRVEFGPLDDKGRLTDRVEVLSEGRHAVFAGVHPKTKLPYTWTTPLVPFDQLPIVSPTQIRAFLEELRTILPAAKPLITEGATTDIAQASLKGSLDTVRKAVKATPNNSKAFGTREAYRDYGYAIKAALPDNEPEAFELYSDWCARWEDGINDPAIVQADWRRMKGPYRRGSNWLYELAEEHNPAEFKKIDMFFDVITTEEPLFNTESLQKPLEAPAAIKWVDPFEWQGVVPPKRKFVVAGMIPDGEVTLLTGAGGVGKTLLAQQIGTAVSQGLPVLGRETIKSKVMLFLCEDSEDELQLRQRDICRSMNLDLSQLSNDMRIASRKFMDNLLAVWDRNNGVMKRTAVWHALRDDVVAFGAKLIVVDTIADTFGGNEIDRSHVRQFVQACLGKLAQDAGGAVLALGHPSKAGQAIGGDGTSGSTAWHASVRSRLYLTHAAKDKTGPYRRLENMKANYGAGGDVFMVRWLRGAFDLVTTKSSAPEDGEPGDGATALATAIHGGAAAGVPSMADTVDDALLLAVAETAGEVVAMTDAYNSPHYAPKVLRKRSEILMLYPMPDIEAGWLRVVKAGRVVPAVVGRKADRKPISAYVLASRPVSEKSSNLFD